MSSEQKTEQKVEIRSDVVIAPLPNTERGFGIHLGGTLKIAPRIAYCTQHLVVQRRLDNVNDVSICPLHGYKANVAKYHPNGEWICSGDEAGNCMVWAHQSFVVKNNITVGKKVVDVAWSDDGSKIFAVGSGKDDKGKVFPWNTNNKLGEISGAQKGFLSCDFKPTRPYRLIGSSEDFGVYIYSGPPFKFESYDTTHKNYANCVRYRPDGEVYISVGSDKQILVFDGKEGKKVREIQSKDGHKGSVYEISWSPDGKEFVTASADKTVKLWDFESGNVLHTWTFNDKPSTSDMQISCLWLGQYILSVSLSGVINFLVKDKERPVKVLTGHRKSAQDLCVDRANGYVYTCDTDSRVVRTTVKTGECVDLVGDPHDGTQIKFIRLSSDNNTLYTVGVDDRVVRSEIKNLQLGTEGVKLDGAVRAVAISTQTPDLFLVGTHKQKIEILKGLEIKSSIELDATPSSAALSADDRWLAVGTVEKKILVFDLKNGNKLVKTIENEFIRQEIVDVVFSPDGKYVTSADRNRHIWVWELSGDCANPVNKSQSFQFHNATPSSVAFNPSGKWLVSGGHDNNIYLWLNPTSGNNENIKLENAFNGAIRRVEFLSDTQFVGTSADGSIRIFSVHS